MANKGKRIGNLSMAGLKVGDIRFYERDGKIYSRLATTGYMTNDRTGPQMMNRMRFNSVRCIWRCFKNVLNGSFEGLELGKSAYTTFVRLNHNNGVFLTKTQHIQKAQVITPLHISDGTLDSIRQVINEDKQLVTDLALGDFEITAETTIRDFTIKLADENRNIEYDDELHFVAVRQYVDGADEPRCEVKVVDLKLSLIDERPLLVVIGNFSLCNKDGFLATQPNLPIGCYAFYLSRKEEQRTLVSPQRLVSNNDELIEKYISEEQFIAARKSFGKSKDAWITGWQFKKPTFD